MGFKGLAYGTLVGELFCCFAAAFWLFKHQLLWAKCQISWRKFEKCSFELLKLGIAQTIIQSLAGCTAFFCESELNATYNFRACRCMECNPKNLYLILDANCGDYTGCSDNYCLF